MKYAAGKVNTWGEQHFPLEKSPKTDKLINMKLLYKKTLGGICIQRYYSLDGQVRIPEQAEGQPVRELDSYVFSQTVRGREMPPQTVSDEPAVMGDVLEELVLPETLRKVGAYAFYNCPCFKRLSCYSTVEDWGAGVFTGCSGLEELDIRLMGGGKSCLKEILAELRQTLIVSCRNPEGELTARLVFPEFFEESVENTPARIIVREMHGCGHMYRYCFQGPDFDFREYDRLFPHVQVQEKPELVTRLALYRLYWPWDLTEEAAKSYWNYIKEHIKEAVLGLAARGELEILKWLSDAGPLGERELEEMTGAAALAEDARVSSVLMDAGHRHRENVGLKKKRTFEL